MKIIKRGDTYTKLNWFEQHELQLYLVGIIVVGIANFIVISLML